MGAGPSAGGSSGNVGPAGITTAGTYGTAKDAQKASERNEFRNRGATSIKKNIAKFPTPTLVVASKPLQAGSKVTRDFYTDKVLGSKNFKGQTKADFLNKSAKEQEKQYGEYISNRQSGKTDAYGNPTPQGGESNNTPAPTILKKTAGGQTIQTTAPTEAELSQSAAADAEAYDLRKSKKRGRSMTTLTSARGLTDNKLTLGKPSLLGS
tara:strand:- start:7 stop:633 length:627 start_codon:yes stop_codon:yes gene_type:complete